MLSFGSPAPKRVRQLMAAAVKGESLAPVIGTTYFEETRTEGCPMPIPKVSLPLLTALVLLILVGAGCSDDDPVAPVGNRTLAVPSRFATIQSAVDAARAGDVVLVAAGISNESPVRARYEADLATSTSQD